MHSILGSSYPISAKVQSATPAQVSPVPPRTAAPKPAVVSAADPSRLLSSRVTAFIATDPSARARSNRSDNTATQGKADPHRLPRPSDNRAAGQDASVLIDESETYQPTSIY